MELNLVLPLPTSINKLYINQYQFNPTSRRNEPTGKRILSADGRSTKARIQGQARVQMKGQDWDFDWTRDHYVYQDAIIYFTRRGSDDNNIYKLLNDSLEGITYENDSRVLVRTQRIVYDSKNPRVEVTLTPVDFIGIFEDRMAYDVFTYDFCSKCTRYRNGSCSILKDSIAGTVREEIGSIHKPICSQFKEKK